MNFIIWLVVGGLIGWVASMIMRTDGQQGVIMNVVVGIIGYRFFRTNGSVAPAEVTAVLPKGAKVTATAVADDRIAVTIEQGGMVEVRTFDLKTLRPTGRIRFATEP